ncbi:tektin-4-like [Leguminivora glycinivorella]|uniref:tektin-4-like n=1 Tax=Leguminivora glycinivorella TaxID=1035111 RepID=UPI00200EE575|nr:tektin-4-like [Leguminivora glycinivorella]
MASGEPNLQDCPYICPSERGKHPGSQQYGVAGGGSHENPYERPYVPGQVQPPVHKVYPAGSPPTYLPQPTESTSGDFLGMSGVGPWAAGHLDWTPQAGITGVRPVVDKYSITRYSTGEWRRNNEAVLTPRATDKAIAMEKQFKKEIADTFDQIQNAQNDSNNNLKKRVKDLSSWQKKVEAAEHAITEEINILDEYRARLKAACRILMLPEAIAKECLELRTSRYEPDLVRDDAEQELVNEVAIVGEIRRVFTETLAKAENQMLKNKAAKAAIESDWSDKMLTLKVDKKNLRMSPESSLILAHPGVARWPENGTTKEYWEHYCSESIRNCDDVRHESENLRGDLMTAITKGAQDLKTQGDRTNMALVDSIVATQQCCDHLEKNLKENLQKTADVENLIDYLNESLRKVDASTKLSETRLHGRNYERPNVENCRDEAQYALIAEHKLIKEKAEALRGQARQAEAVRSELMKYRGELEKEIACKRKSLSINEDRCARARAHMPTPEDFAAL